MPTSFPRQDLKTSIAIEFIKVIWYKVCVRNIKAVIPLMPSSSVQLCFSNNKSFCVYPVCASRRSRQKFRFSSSFLSPAHLYLTLTHWVRDGEEEGGGRDGARCQGAVNVRACLLVFPKPLLLSPPFSPLPEVTGLYKKKRSQPPTLTHTFHLFSFSVIWCVVS